MLRLGSTGHQVKELQTMLRIQADGIFGPITDRHVRDFQSKNNLNVDGIVGPRTLNILMEKHMGEIVPIFDNIDVNEDQSDPEEEMKIKPQDEKIKSSKCSLELINLIENTDISRNVSKLIFHCTATQGHATISGILKYWKNTLRWRNPGYHLIIKEDGSWTQLVDFNQRSNGVQYQNHHSIHASYIGGIDSQGRAKDTRTDMQKEIFKVIYESFAKKIPNLTFHGHNEFANKDCPCFNVSQWIRELSSERDIILQ